MDLFAGETKAVIEEEIDKILDDRETVTVEADLVDKDGTRHPYEFTGVPVEDREEVLGVVGIGRDNSE